MGELAEDAFREGEIRAGDEMVDRLRQATRTTSLKRKGDCTMTMLTKAPAKPAASVAVPTLGKLTRRTIRPRIVINAVEGWGKTSAAAYAPNCAILMARGETGYETLMNAGRVPEITAAKIDSWKGLLGLLDGMIANPPCEYLALDAQGGFERLCHEMVCQRDFDGDWGEKGFTSFAKGYDVAIADWLLFLQRLDRLHEKGVGIIMLSHSRIRPFKNPLGPDYDKYTSDSHEKTWATTAKWADAVLFGTFQTVTEQDRQTKKFKGIGGTQRVLHTQQTDAYVAKNRYGMEPTLTMPEDPAQMWPTIINAINGKPAAVVEDEIPA
jgi:hypothetical protein